MSSASRSGNRKIDELCKSIKKNGLNSTNKTPSDDKFISPKRRRRLQPGKEEELTKLFVKISDDPFYENEVPSFSNNSDASPTEQDLDSNPPYTSVHQQLEWLYSGSSSCGDSHGDDTIPTVDDLGRMADKFLEEDLTEQLKQALSSTELQYDSDISYRFFSEYCKLPNPLLHQENVHMTDSSMTKKYNHIVKYSQPEDKRNFFLCSGQLTLWHRLGWECPQSVLRWLIEVVAFDKNIESASRAMNTIFELWFDMLRKKSPMVSMADGINNDRKMTVDIFSYIMTSYGALNLPTTDDIDTPTTSKQQDGDDVMMANEDDVLNGGGGGDRIPLTQFGWVLDLLKLSLTLWPEAYTVSQLHYFANTLVCLGMDGIGVLVLKHIQDALEACLRAFPGCGDDDDDDSGPNWKTQVHQLALTLCKQQFVTVELQVRLPTIAKSTCDRCFYLRRVIAFIALELAFKKDQQETITTTNTMAVANGATDLLAMVSSQVTLESLSPYLGPDGAGMIPPLAAMVEDPGSVFQEADPCYRDYADRVCLLDYAIGNDYTEFLMCIDEIQSLVTQLQASSRKIGGGLGTIEKTKANEVTQRLWSRLAYVIGRNGNTVEDIEF